MRFIAMTDYLELPHSEIDNKPFMVEVVGYNDETTEDETEVKECYFSNKENALLFADKIDTMQTDDEIQVMEQYKIYDVDCDVTEGKLFNQRVLNSI